MKPLKPVIWERSFPLKRVYLQYFPSLSCKLQNNFVFYILVSGVTLIRGGEVLPEVLDLWRQDHPARSQVLFLAQVLHAHRWLQGFPQVGSVLSFVGGGGGVSWIRIQWIRIRIQHFKWIRIRIQIQGFDFLTENREFSSKSKCAQKIAYEKVKKMIRRM